jgi:hypothetical protein
LDIGLSIGEGALLAINGQGKIYTRVISLRYTTYLSR